MNQIIETIAYLREVIAVQMIDIIFAISMILFFRIFSSSMAYIIIRMFKLKVKSRKKIKESAFYNPLRVFFSLLGIYSAVVFLKQPFGISNEVMVLATRAFEIISVIVFAKGLAASFLPKSTLVKKMKEKTNNVEDSMFDFMLKIIRVVIYIIAGFLVITLLGVNLNGLVAGLGISGVIVTLAAQDTAKNLFGGLVIFLDKPFMVGDWIEMPPYEGTVEDITFRSTRVRTFENSVVNIPNSIIANASIINWSKMEKRRYKINLCIQIDTPLEKLEKFQAKVRDMLQAREAIYDESIIVKFDAIQDNGLNVLISSFTESVDYLSYVAEKENINRKIMKILREEEIELAYDTKTIYVKK
ncbi:MAG: mechanosensitive ion channel family protein [Clostridia bacterium]|nr:mechanosensitive ion channel family protein [Clostridia bacterium]